MSLGVEPSPLHRKKVRAADARRRYRSNCRRWRAGDSFLTSMISWRQRPCTLGESPRCAAVSTGRSERGEKRLAAASMVKSRVEANGPCLPRGRPGQRWTTTPASPAPNAAETSWTILMAAAAHATFQPGRPSFIARHRQVRPTLLPITDPGNHQRQRPHCDGGHGMRCGCWVRTAQGQTRGHHQRCRPRSPDRSRVGWSAPPLTIFR